MSASYQVIIREDDGIVLPGDLEGRKIGIFRGSLSEIALRNMAKDFGVNLDAVELLHAEPMRQLELFVNHEIDAVACWEPWASQARYVGGMLYFSGLYSNIPGHEGPVNWLTGQSVLVTFKDRISSEPDRLLALLRSLHHATEFLNTTLQKAASVFSDLLEIEHDELVMVLQKNMYSMKMDDLFHVGLASVLDIVAELEQFSSPRQNTQHSPSPLRFMMEDLYTSDLLTQIEPTLTQLVKGKRINAPAELLCDGTLYYYSDTHIKVNPSKPLRCVIVDDTDVVIELFSTIVSSIRGEVVGTASNGAEAMVLYLDVLPDVVVMDISMPDMNGLEAIKGILRINPEANIIIVTGNNYEDVRKQAFELGIKLFIGKPFSPDEVARVLTRMLS
jgi:CheY-like chemotaxis protein